MVAYHWFNIIRVNKSIIYDGQVLALVIENTIINN